MRAMIASAVLLLPLAATAAEAQQQKVLSQRVAKSMPSAYRAPDCGLKSGHFKVSSGASYLKTGIEADVPDNKARALDSGEKVLLEAMQQNGQTNNAAAWYYLGRIYLQRGDLYGADSALTRAEKLAPNCAKEIDGYRQNAWVALIKGGNGFEEQKNLDSALALYNQAGVIFRKSPIPYYQAASVYQREGQDRQRGRVLRQGGHRRRERNRHDREEDPRPVRLQPGRDPAQRAEASGGSRGLRAVSQVAAERHRGQARPGRGVPGHGSGGQGPGAGAADRSRRRDRAARPVGRGRAAPTS